MPVGPDVLLRQGMRISTSIDPLQVVWDVSNKVRKISPDQVPFQSMDTYFVKGPAPQGEKVTTQLEWEFDPHDQCLSCVVGSTTSPNYKRYALIRPAQSSRQTTASSMFYAVKDKIMSPETGQSFVVVMTDTGAYAPPGGSAITLPTDLTGNTTSRTNPGFIVVENIKPEPIIAIPAGGQIFYGGRTAHESADYGGTPRIADIFYDCNFVETQEQTFSVSRDVLDLVKTRGPESVWQRDWDYNVNIAKQGWEFTSLWGQGEVWMDGNRPTRFTRGLFPSIKTNVFYYNPTTVTDFEFLVQEWMVRSAFRYNPNGTQSPKMVFAGKAWSARFERSFGWMRRTDLSNRKITPAGLAVTEYTFSTYTIRLMDFSPFRIDGRLQNWAVAVDPLEVEIRNKFDWRMKDISLSTQRDRTMAIEKQGCYVFHREQSHSVMMTM